MRLPAELLKSLEGVSGFEPDRFVQVHEEANAPTSVRLNPWKPVSAAVSQFENAALSPVPWASAGYYLSHRPSFTFDPLFHAGCYYVQEASSMFLEQAEKQLVNTEQQLRVLGPCASPGGKSTHLQTLLSSESLLVSNEVIKQRSLVLTDNIIRWGCRNVFVTNNDPKAFQKLPGFFDVMVVDAPCSGSGLFRKDEDAVTEWSLHNVTLCSQRQQRILADALPAVKEDGLLIYSTCSYSVDEDEMILDWLVEEMKMENCKLNIDGFPGIVETLSETTKAVGYRFYPDKVKGEGFFLACFRKTTSDGEVKMRSTKNERISLAEQKAVDYWVTGTDLQFIRFRNYIAALPPNSFNDFSVLQQVVNLQYAGVLVGEVLKDKLVPHHAFSQSTIIKKEIPATQLSYSEAIKYLQRQDLSTVPETIGWQVVRYQGHNLGWISALKNRINNYYPKEIRILKARNDSAFEK